MDMLKELEMEEYSFEDAEGSLASGAGVLGKRRRFFEVRFYRILSPTRDDKNAQAYVKVEVDGQVEITAEEGDGPGTPWT